MDRKDVSTKILFAKVAEHMTWSGIAEKIGQPKEWTTAALLGHASINAQQAAVAKELFSLTDEEVACLQSDA